MAKNPKISGDCEIVAAKISMETCHGVVAQSTERPGNTHLNSEGEVLLLSFIIKVVQR